MLSRCWIRAVRLRALLQRELQSTAGVLAKSRSGLRHFGELFITCSEEVCKHGLAELPDCSMMQDW